MPIISHEGQRSEIALSNLVQVRNRFLRSVNLERDIYTLDPLEGYILTPSALLGLERVASAIDLPYTRAISITGAYGSGKSAFALFTAKALSPTTQGSLSPQERVRHLDPDLANRITFRGAAFWPVLVTGARVPVARALTDGLIASLNRLPDKAGKAVAKLLKNAYPFIEDERIPAASEVAALYETAAKLARKKSSACRGLFVVVDEMGKFLEYAALHPSKGDMQVFQELAEAASRSQEAPILFITILHQAFEDYAHRLSPVQRNEWQKVQGRFIDIPFGDGPEETMRLVAQAIVQQEVEGIDSLLAPTIQSQLEWCQALQIFPAFLSAGEYRENLRSTYPLHPLALRIMPHLFRRFGQNERSLFSFLSSEEPFGFQEFLREHSLGFEQVPLLRLDHLYDYVVATLGSTLYSHPTAKLWSETEDALFRLSDRRPLYGRLIKTIGLLHILGEQTRLLPSKEVLAFALVDETTSTSDVEKAINELETATIITFRQFKKAYRLYEGSDIDIDARLREAYTHFAHGTDTINVARQMESSPPIVARRHSYERGTLRTFDVRYCRPNALLDEIDREYGEADGLLLLCLALDSDDLRTLSERISEMLRGRSDVIVGLSVETDTLHQAAVAVESLLWVKDNTPELHNDRVATREVDERLLDAKAAFQTEWERLLRPMDTEDDGGIWIYKGEQVPLVSYRQLQELVSKACDETYCFAPRLLNELVNRRHLSSTAAAARRNLIEAMLTKNDQPRLGLEGFPPERSMYASILESTGIHASVNAERWAIQPPMSSTDEGLRRVWIAMEDWLFAGDLHPQPLTDLLSLLRAQPYGLTDGIIYVLLCAVLIYHAKEVGIYEEGRFVIDLDIATYERLIKRPEDYAIQGCRVAGERQALLDRFGRGLLRDDEERTVMNVARQLYRVFRRLPEYVIRTRMLDSQARALRDALKTSSQPEQLLFVNLPQCLGLRPFSEFDVDPENVVSFFERWNIAYSALLDAYPRLLSRLEEVLCEAFNVVDWTEMRHRAAILLPYVTDSVLRSLVLRASDETLEKTAWIESLATLILGRPPASWGDMDEQLFAQRLPPLASAFGNALLVAFAKKQRIGTDDQVGMRIAVTLDTGTEDARVVVTHRQEAERINELSLMIIQAIQDLTRNESEVVRLAAIAKATQDLLRGGDHE